MKKFLIYFFTLLILVAAGIGGYSYYKVNHFLNTTPVLAEEAQDVIIEIKPGSNLNQVAELLYEKNIITDAFSFSLLTRYLKADTKLQAGQFMFNTGWLPKQVVDQLINGKEIFHRLTIREGLTWWEVGHLLEKEGYATYEDFKKIIHDPEFLRHYGIPFKNAEGFLYPDTYFLPKPKTLDEKSARSVAGRLIDTFWKKTGPLWKKIEPEKRLPSKDTLTRYLSLASIVEKETGIAHERAKVAGVYTNRINKNMLLQADPTVAYGMGEEFKPPLLTRHLKNENNPYNTYQKAGLPPGPICSPSIFSLEASFAPEKHDYFYFVAKGTDGSHYFAKTLREHNNNVRKYRQTQK